MELIERNYLLPNSLKTKCCFFVCVHVFVHALASLTTWGKKTHSRNPGHSLSTPNLSVAYPNIDKTKAAVIIAGATRNGAILVKTISDRSFIVAVSSLHVIQQCFTKQCLPPAASDTGTVCVCMCMRA